MELLPWALSLSLVFLVLENKGRLSRQMATRLLAHASYFTVNSCLLILIVPLFFSTSFGEGGVGLSRYPLPIQFLVILFVLDLCSYGLHVLSHRVPFLFYFHQVHHSDKQIDATTALRMHSGQMFYSLIPDVVFILLFTPTREAYLLFALFTQFCVLFHHTQLAVPKSLGRLFVIPEFHIEHHRLIKRRAVNFGSVFSFWDHFFRTSIEKRTIGPVGLGSICFPFSFRELFFPYRRSPQW